MLGNELAVNFHGLRRLLYSKIGILDVDERIWEIHFRKYFFPILQLTPSARILDAGCGEGLWSFELARKFPQHQVVGIDIRSDVIEYCNRLKESNSMSNIQFDTLKFVDLAFDGEFDVILSFFSLHYSYRNDLEILERFARALRPGGWLFLTVPVAHKLWNSSSKTSSREVGKCSKYGMPIEFDEFLSHYTFRELSDKMLQAQFSPVKFHRIAGRWAQKAKRMYASASSHALLKFLLWPLAITLGYIDTILPEHNGMIWLVAARKNIP